MYFHRSTMFVRYLCRNFRSCFTFHVLLQKVTNKFVFIFYELYKCRNNWDIFHILNFTYKYLYRNKRKRNKVQIFIQRLLMTILIQDRKLKRIFFNEKEKQAYLLFISHWLCDRLNLNLWYHNKTYFCKCRLEFRKKTFFEVI